MMDSRENVWAVVEQLFFMVFVEDFNEFLK